MEGQTSFATLSSFRCPICGALQARKASIGHNSSFACSRCQTELEVTTSRSLTVLSASILMSLSLTIAMGLRGPSFALALVGAAAAFNWLGQLMGRFVAGPKLRVRPNAEGRGARKNVPSARRPDRRSRANRERGSLKCPLVVTHD
jgi:hypothetical protein